MAYGAVAGLNRKATRLTRGAISLSSSSHLPTIEPSIRVKPVTCRPAAKARNETAADRIDKVAKMIGMVRVWCRSGAVVGVFCERIRSGCSATISLANRCINSASSAAQRVVDPDIAAVRPAELLKSLPERPQQMACASGSLSDTRSHADPAHSVRLLRARRERPRRSRAGDQLTPSHVEHPASSALGVAGQSTSRSTCRRVGGKAPWGRPVHPRVVWARLGRE